MKFIKIIFKWWKKNQEESSERYLEREDFKKELKEYSKDIEAVFDSPAMDFQERTLEKASLIQNMHLQRKLTQSTESLKLATWILALATIIFAWATIIDSPNSSYFIQNLQGIASILVFIFISLIAVVLAWSFIKFIWKSIRRFWK